MNSLLLCGLLDSGSPITILGNNSHLLLMKHGFTLNEYNKIKGSVANGQSFEAIGTINLPVVFNNKRHSIIVHVIPSITQPLILGIDFWSKFNLAPDILKHLTDGNDSNKVNQFLVTPDYSKISHYDSLDDVQRLAADNIIEKFKNISTETQKLGRTDLVEHRIDTGDHPPLRQRCYRISPVKQEALANEVKVMLDLDVIEPCESPWLNPVLITPKKDGEWRFCIDSRKLNDITKKDAYKLPFINDILDNLRNAKYLSSIDIAKAFWEIGLREEDRNKTAFHVPGLGMFRFKVMPFGLTNAPATQQRFIDSLLSDSNLPSDAFDSSMFCYLDDIIISTATFEDHIKLLSKLEKKLRDAKITINFKKCAFFRKELKYLGYIVDEHGLRTDPEKVKAILAIPTPKSKRELKKFLGTASWYRRFIPNFSTVAAPLNSLTSTGKKAPPFQWSDTANEAFEKLKSALTSTPILTRPDFSKPFAVHCDASNFGVGAMLTQDSEGVEKPIAYFSKSLNGAQKNYSVTERELLSVITALEHWRCYLDNGQKFTIYTDHSALQWFLNLDNPSGRLARWSIRLSMFNFDIKHKKGKDNVIPDALSRIVPVSLINYNPSTSNDAWYNAIRVKCLNNPNSCPEYNIKNNKLYRYCRTNTLISSEYDWKEVIPSEIVRDIIAENHLPATSAHFGTFKTYSNLKRRYFWKGMYRDVANFISNCETCIAYKHQTQATLGLMGKAKVCARPFQTISIDLIGPLPMSRKLNRYIFVVTCCFSKYCLLFPIKKATTTILKHILENLVFMTHGIPETIIMDNGPQFISNELLEMLKSYNIPQIHHTSVHTPQVNTVERYNKTIITAVASYVNEDHRTWDLNLNKIQFAINSSVNEVTKFTPAFLVFGRELVSCGSIYNNTDTTDEIIFAPRDVFADNIGLLSPFFSKVQNKLWLSHQRNSLTYDKKRQHVEFNIGDTVWKRNYTQSAAGNYYSAKLAPKFVKCLVSGKISPLVYELSDLTGHTIGRWHVKDLKPRPNI